MKPKRINIDEFVFGLTKSENDYLLKPNQAKNCYNLKIEEGHLIQGNGLTELELLCEGDTTEFTKKFIDMGFEIIRVWRYKYFSTIINKTNYALIIYASDKKLYYSPLFAYTDEFYQVPDVQFNSIPTALNFRAGGKEVIGFCSPTDEFVVWNCDEQPYITEGLPKFSCICLHNGRLFAIDSAETNVVKYSSLLNPLDWSSNQTSTSGGSIELNDFKGDLKNIISFLDNIYVFSDFGISKISSFLGNSNFGVSNVYTTSFKIFCNTACVCGDNILFLTEDGMYKFDGFNVTKLESSFSHLIKNTTQENAISSFFEGKYFVACSLTFGDGKFVGVEKSGNYQNNALIEYDINSCSYSITRGVDVCWLLSVKDLKLSKLFACLRSSHKMYQVDSSGLFGTEPLEKSWQGGKINFGNFDKYKILKEVYLTSLYPCFLKVETETGTQIYNIKKNKQMQRVRINKRGKYFGIEFYSNNPQVYLSNPQFLFSVQE